MEQAHQKSIIIEVYCDDAVFVSQVNSWVEKIKENGMKNILVA
jgi:TusA-related sulfurtransferase